MPQSNKPTRGVRNNNPGNIRESRDDKTQWVGERATDDDVAFEEFTHPKYGVRALAKILLAYQNKHGLRTVRGIINRWAPAIENDTDSYVIAVAKACGVKPDSVIDVKAKLSLLVQAIIHHENGYDPYSPAELVEWCALAL